MVYLFIKKSIEFMHLWSAFYQKTDIMCLL